MATKAANLLRTAPAPLSAASLFGGVLLIVTGHPAAAIVGGALILFAMLVPFLRLQPDEAAPVRGTPEHTDTQRSPGSPDVQSSAEVAPRTRASNGPVLLDVDVDGERGLRWRGTSDQLAQLLVPPPPQGRGKPDEALAREWGADDAVIRQVRARLLASIGEDSEPPGRRPPDPES